MAIRLAHFNFLTKTNVSKSILTVRCCCKVPKVTFNSLSQASAKPRLRYYFTSINRNQKYGTKTKKSPRYSYDVSIDVPDNVLLYTDGDRRTFFGLVQVLSIGAFLMFMLIGDTMRQVIGQLRKAPVAEGESIKWYQWWKRLQPESKTAGNLLFFLLSAAGKCMSDHG